MLISQKNSLAFARSPPSFCGRHIDRQCDNPWQYFDPLACKCFNKARCYKLCPEGEEFDPRKMCTCIPGEEVVALYPEEAHDYLPEYLKKYLSDSNPRCSEEDLLEPCLEGMVFNEEHCMCFREKKCRK